MAFSQSYTKLLPMHVAFIMDGNNRWSKKNNKTKYFSYNLGAKKLIDLSKFIFDNYDINFVTNFKY